MQPAKSRADFVSTLSRLKAAGHHIAQIDFFIVVSTLSRLKAAGEAADMLDNGIEFQHSAA